MFERPNRTFISSVLFLDIVGYTQHPVSKQIVLKEHFNQLVSALLRDIPDTDRIILDTGDGAAISFLGDPEDALFVAVKLRDSICENKNHDFPDLSVRMGINLGPVKLLKDINGRPNLIGDGINVAQRVMSFAEPDQILVSRSFFEVVSCLSQEYAELFSYQGMHKDKHIREHELYEIGFSAVAPSATATELTSSNLEVIEVVNDKWDDKVLDKLESAIFPFVGPLAKGLVKATARKSTTLEEFTQQLAAQLPYPEDRNTFLKTVGEQHSSATPPLPLSKAPISAASPSTVSTPSPNKHKTIFAVAATIFIAIVVALLFGGKHKSPSVELPGNAIASNSQTQPIPAVEPPLDMGPKVEIKKPAIPEKKLVTMEPATNKNEVKQADKNKKPIKNSAPAEKNKIVEKELSQPAKAAIAAPAANEKIGFLNLQVVPSGEIYIDGNKIGSSPPIHKIPLSPGKHRIQISGNTPPYSFLEFVTIEAGGSKSLNFKFSDN